MRHNSHGVCGGNVFTTYMNGNCGILIALDSPHFNKDLISVCIWDVFMKHNEKTQLERAKKFRILYLFIVRNGNR